MKDQLLRGKWKGTIMSMCSQSAPQRSIRSASDAKFEKSDESIDGAIFGFTIFGSDQRSAAQLCKLRENWIKLSRLPRL